MKIGLKPETILGKCSIGLILGYFVLFAVFMILVGTGQSAGDDIYGNLVLTIPGFLAGICAVSALVTGTIAIVKSKERSLFAFIAAGTGLYLIIVTLVEFLI